MGCSSASLPPTTIQDGGRTDASDSHRVAKTHSVSLITVSMNGVDVLKLLSRMAADTSSIVTRLEQWKNFTFTRHEFLLVTVKEWLKSVLNYRSYPKNKTGYPFLDHHVYRILCRMRMPHTITGRNEILQILSMQHGDINCCRQNE